MPSAGRARSRSRAAVRCAGGQALRHDCQTLGGGQRDVTHQMPRVEAGGGPRHGPAMGLGFTLVRSVALPILTVFAVPILAKEISPKGDRAVTVRADPDSHSRPVGTLNPGDHATVRGAERQWWEVSLSDGTDGFVSKRSTEVVPDSGSSGGRGGDGSAGASPTGEGWNAFAGYPTCRRPDCQFEVLEKHEFAIGYSETHRDPLWVAYHLFPMNPENHDPRPGSFTVDEDTTAQVDQQCYRVAKGKTNPFDKGHNAPNSAIDGRYGQTAQLDTFKMSNVCPQAACLNEGAWQGFEKIESEDYGQRFQRTWTITGPVFDSNPDTMNCGVQVPNAFYKIVVMNDDGHPAAIAIQMTQDERRRREAVSTFVTTVKHIEDETGLDFFPRLSGADKMALENGQPDARWNVDQVMAPDHPCRLGSQ